MKKNRPRKPNNKERRYKARHKKYNVDFTFTVTYTDTDQLLTSDVLKKWASFVNAECRKDETR